MGLPDGEKDLQNTWTRFKTMHDVTDGQTPHDGGGRAVHNVAEKSAESLSHLVWRSFWRMWVGVVLMIEDVIQCKREDAQSHQLAGPRRMACRLD